MSKVRVTYTALISFATNLISVITGLVFVIIVTRSLTPDEFGTWGLISGLLAYAVIISPNFSNMGNTVKKQQLIYGIIDQYITCTN